MKTKELTNVPGLNPDDVVLIRKLGANSMTKIRSKIMVVSSDEFGNSVSRLDMGLYQKWLFLYGIVESPFFEKQWNIIKKESVFESDEDFIEVSTLDYVFKELQVLNNFEQLAEKKKD